ncbi:hypothetical protein F4801DRAFT_580422 [Xylaria longipes]|nr:hypothetical protein F4801DRAFT_580422 [Xylaria longipes]
MSDEHDPLALPDYYADLGVPKGASTAEIHARFRKVFEAYECLSNPGRRGIYNIRYPVDEWERFGKPGNNETAAEDEKKAEARKAREHLVQGIAVQVKQEETSEREHKALQRKQTQQEKAGHQPPKEELRSNDGHR